MKLIKTLVIAWTLLVPAYMYAQSSDASSHSSKQRHSFQRKTKRQQIKSADSSDINAILKDSSNAETGPILNDNGSINSTGAIDGSRSSTGRPDADTASYTVKRKKTVVRNGYTSPRDTTKRRRKP